MAGAHSGHFCGHGLRAHAASTLCNATLAYALKIANKGYEKAAAEDPGFAEGINMIGGRVTNAAVAESFHLPCHPLKTK
jgi:alanine dehydrogenase